MVVSPLPTAERAATLYATAAGALCEGGVPMGTFEKLGILVIVVIIVMILAVAIYQWGGAGAPETTVEVQGGLTVKALEDLREGGKKTDPIPGPPPPVATWPGGIPKSYRISRDDKVWDLVVKKWGLKESFVDAIKSANPKVNFKTLRPGQELVIPDPSGHTRASGEKPAPPPKPSGARTYEVQDGDTLESIAYRHLGAKTRWRDIETLNPGLDVKRLREGQEIYLPLK
jgi:LysM repeat protein